MHNAKEQKEKKKKKKRTDNNFYAPRDKDHESENTHSVFLVCILEHYNLIRNSVQVRLAVAVPVN